MGIFNFWNLSARLPLETLEALRKASFNFIMCGKKNCGWKQMTLPKGEGGLGIRCFREAAKVAAIKRTYRLWTCEKSIWSTWMRERYVKGRNMIMINTKIFTDSTAWMKEVAGMYVNIFKCKENYGFEWHGAGKECSYKNAWKSIREKGPRDRLSGGIWASGILKHDMLLWRARWRKVWTNAEIERT